MATGASVLRTPPAPPKGGCPVVGSTPPRLFIRLPAKPRRSCSVMVVRAQSDECLFSKLRSFLEPLFAPKVPAEAATAKPQEEPPPPPPPPPPPADGTDEPAALATEHAIADAVLATEHAIADAALATEDAIAHAALATEDAIADAAFATENAITDAALATEDAIAEFISQVSSLIKLIDSLDIVELHLKQLDCELLIRKKEALLHPPLPPAPAVMTMHSPPPLSAYVPPPVAASPPPSAPPAAKSSKPPLKSPMAGTFYRSPAPGAPPFIKVGDKVEKGQVLFIIEAMKLMNEIESDRSGTVVEILVADGKPIAILWS